MPAVVMIKCDICGGLGPPPAYTITLASPEDRQVSIVCKRCHADAIHEVRRWKKYGSPWLMPEAGLTPERSKDGGVHWVRKVG